MPANYVLIQKITVDAAGAASVTFANIPQTGYTDLVLKVSARTTSTNQTLLIQFNSDTTATNYRRLALGGTGSGSGFSQNINDQGIGYVPISTYTANTFGNGEIYIPNYTSSNAKSYSSDSTTENNDTESYLTIMATYWSGTAAITSIRLTTAANFVANSTFYLYGIAKSGTVPTVAPYATGGDTVTSDGTYFIHTFLSSGTFTPKKAISNIECLVVAGGGGGGAGGGGAGGFRTATGLSAASGSGVTVTVGAGGGGGGFGSKGGNGTNSVFSSITSTGGGGGGYADQSGNNGGSGGGSSQGSAGSGNTPSTSPSQGNNGGTGWLGAYGGGGGASAAGQSVSSGLAGGAGGNGTASSISGSSVTYAGGGGGGIDGGSAGGAGGTGGGGQGVTNRQGTATSGTANTGGGGGGRGSGNDSVGASGGSGIVIVRYPI